MSDIYAEFCSDQQLVELLEACKSGSELLEILRPRENQHSDILAWCFNSKEGHGQGDAILRDFILAIYRAASEKQAGDLLSGNGYTRSFVKEWSPTRILTTSFATAAFFREYQLPSQLGGKKRANGRQGNKGDRIDLLIVDTENRFIVVVENKAGAKKNDAQLARYLTGIRRCLLSKAAFAGFRVAFAALDTNYDRESEDSEAVAGIWVRLNYDWLEPAAKRAELMLSRGNDDAALVLSYCRQQTDWESEKTKSISRLARRIAIAHREVVSRLGDVSRQLKNPSSWTPGILESDSLSGQLLRLSLQNEVACKALVNLPPIQLLHGVLCEQLPHLELDAYVDMRRVKVSYRPRLVIPQTEDYWPLYVFVRQLPGVTAPSPRFVVRMVWSPRYVSPEHRTAVTSIIHEYFPAAKKVIKKSNHLERRYVDSIGDAARAVKEMLEKCEALPLPRDV